MASLGSFPAHGVPAAALKAATRSGVSFAVVCPAGRRADVLAALQSATNGAGLVLSSRVVARAAKGSSGSTGEDPDEVFVAGGDNTGEDHTGDEVFFVGLGGDHTDEDPGNGATKGTGAEELGNGATKDTVGDDNGNSATKGTGGDELGNGATKGTVGDELGNGATKDTVGDHNGNSATKGTGGDELGNGATKDTVGDDHGNSGVIFFGADELSLSRQELIDFLAKKTDMVLDQFRLSKPQGAAFQELQHLRNECQNLVNEGTDGRISCFQAEIRLLGLHSRMSALLMFCREQKTGTQRSTSAPSTLEKGMMNSLLLSMGLLKEQLFICVKKESQKDDFGPRGDPSKKDATLPELLRSYIDNTTQIVDNLPDLVLLPRDGNPAVTLGKIVFSTLELQELQNRCHILQEEVRDAAIPDHVAVGTLLGIQSRVKVLLVVVRGSFYGEFLGDGGRAVPAMLGVMNKRLLCFSMSQIVQSLNEYNRN